MNRVPAAWLFFLWVTLLAALTACDGKTPPAPKPLAPPVAKGKPVIVSTTPLLHEMVVLIVGDKAEAICLFKHGRSLAEPDLTAADTAAIRRADMVLIHRVTHEATLLQTIEANAAKDRIHSLTRRDDTPSNPAIATVPSLTPAATLDLLDHVITTLQSFDAKLFSDAASRSQPLRNEIQALVKWIDEQLATTLAEHRVVVTDDEMSASVLRSLGFSAVLVPRHASVALTQADMDGLTASITESKARVIVLSHSPSETMQDMLAQISKSTGIRTLRTPLLTWPTADVGYIAMMKANLQALLAAIK